MSQQLGRISGPLLKDNLLRDGINLEFSDSGIGTSLLYLEVNNRRISVNTIGSEILNVGDGGNPGTVRTVDLLTNSAKLANIEIGIDGANIISTDIGGISLTPEQTDPLILADQLQAGDIDLKDNVVSNYKVNGSIELRSNGLGIVDIQSSSQVRGDLTVTGNITVDGDLSKQGNIIIGDNILQDTVTVQTDFTQSIIPGDDLTYDLGTITKRWRRVFADQNDQIGTLSYDSITVSDQLQIDGATRQIYTLQSNDSVLLNPSTGIVDVENLRFQDNDITNLNIGSVFDIQSTGIGYVRFMGSNGTVIPAGTTAERPITPEVGDTRWNTTLNRLECWDGETYNVATGPGATIGETEMTDLQFVYAVMLG
jgi:hypothetical protein